MNNIYLIGYMCSGKSTLGIALAEQLGVEFVDTDDYIETRCECTVSHIFENKGEAYFRELEAQAVAELTQRTDLVVACGGGLPCHRGNMELMNSHGLTIWLDAPAQLLSERLSLPQYKNHRPKVRHLSDEEIAELVEQELAERRPYYEQAHVRFDASDIETAAEVQATAYQIAELIRQYCS